MKQKIVVELPTNDDRKSRRKAMKIAVRMPGVISVALDGRRKDRLVVVGDGVDAVELRRLLRKNIEKKDEEGGGEKKDKGGGDKGGGGKGGGGSEKKDKPDDSEKKDKEGGGRASEKNDKANGELRKMGANKVYGGWFMYGPGVGNVKPQQTFSTAPFQVLNAMNVAALSLISTVSNF